MACSTIIRGINQVCGSNIGGVRELWIGAFGMVATFTYEYLPTDPDTPVDLEDPTTYVADADGNPIPVSISGVTLATGAETMQKFNFRKGAASATNTLEVSDSGSSFFTNAINCSFPRQDSDKRLSIQSLVEGEACALVKDANGKYWFYGETEPLTVTEGTVETGAQPGDANQYTITISESERRLPLPVADAAVTSLTV